MMKTVAILKGHIEHVYHNETELNDFVIEGATIEEREMEYSEALGWHEVGFVAKLTDKERIEQLENMLIAVMGE